MKKASKSDQQKPRVARAYRRVSHEESASTRLGLDSQKAQIEEWAESNGVTIVEWYEDSPLSGATPVDQRDGLSALLNDIQPGEEREQVRERTIAALNSLRERGVKLGTPPLGMKLKNGDWVEDEKTIHIRERMIELRKEGMGWSRIARIMNGEGMRTKRGKDFQPTTIKQYFNRGHTQDPWGGD